MDNLNQIQIKILSRLLFNPQARFKDLNLDGLTTDNFSYHLRSLLSAGLIKKDGAAYGLTAKGKMLAGKVDTTAHTMERQPKVSVIIIPHKKFGKVDKFLIQQRTKEPYFGYWGFITGKVKFGETLDQTATRELLEEAGISGLAKFCFEIHEMVYDKASGEQLEDKFFHIIEITKLEGQLSATTKEGNNKFVTVEEFRKTTPKYHNEDDMLTWFLNKDFGFKEEKYYIEKF